MFRVSGCFPLHFQRDNWCDCLSHAADVSGKRAKLTYCAPQNGNSADFYRTHPGTLTIEDIFRNYQNSPDEEVATLDTVEKPQTPPKPASNMADVKQEVRETVTNMIRGE